MSRPPDLTPELIERITDHVSMGVDPLPAARAELIPEPTWYGWLRKGRRDIDGPDDDIPPGSVVNPIYAQLVMAVETAEARFEATLVRFAVTHAKTTDQALMVLERHPRTRERWRATRDSKVTHEGALDVTVHTPATEAELRDRLAKVLDFIADMPPGVDNDTPADDAGTTTSAQELHNA